MTDLLTSALGPEKMVWVGGSRENRKWKLQ